MRTGRRHALTRVVRVLLPCALLATQVVFSSSASAAAGDLDPTFGTKGWALSGLDDAHSEHVTDEAISADGKIVVVGSLDSDLAVWRFLPGGDADTSFGGGVVTVPFGERESRAQALLLQPDGAIVAAGYAGARMAVVRLLADGTLDASFGGDGTLSFRIARGVGASAAAAALLADGRIVLGGSTIAHGPRRYGSVLICLKPDGSLDEGFGSNGTVLDPRGFNALTVDDRGIVIAAQTRNSQRFAIARYDFDGVPDPAFGGDGVRRYCVFRTACDGYDFYGVADIAVDASGKLVLAFGGYFVPANDIDGWGVMRLTPEGRRDEGFSGDGVTTLLWAYAGDRPRALAIQDDGRIVLGGFVSAGGGSGEVLATIARLEADGELDATFGDEGTALAPQESYFWSDGVDVALQSDGKIVMLVQPAYDYLYDSFSLTRVLAT